MAQGSHLGCERPHHRVSMWYLGISDRARARATSKAALSDSLNVDRRSIEKHVCRLACVAVVLQRDMRYVLEACVISAFPEDSLLLYVDLVSFDETPMAVGLSEGTVLNRPKASAPSSAVVQQTSLPAMPGLAKRSKGVAKILQSRMEWAMLLRSPDGRLLTITGGGHTWLQILDTTTGEVLAKAGALRDSTTSFANRFRRRLRISILDGAGSNDRSERALMQERAEKSAWARLPFVCEAHAIFNVHSKAFTPPSFPNPLKGTALDPRRPLDSKTDTACSISSGLSMRKGPCQIALPIIVVPCATYLCGCFGLTIMADPTFS